MVLNTGQAKPDHIKVLLGENTRSGSLLHPVQLIIIIIIIMSSFPKHTSFARKW